MFWLEKGTKLISAQAPVGFRATLSGISGGKMKVKKRKSSKKKTAKRKR